VASPSNEWLSLYHSSPETGRSPSDYESVPDIAPSVVDGEPFLSAAPSPTLKYVLVYSTSLQSIYTLSRSCEGVRELPVDNNDDNKNAVDEDDGEDEVEESSTDCVVTVPALSPVVPTQAYVIARLPPSSPQMGVAEKDV